MGTRKNPSAHKSDFKTKKSEEAQNDMRGPYIFQTVCVQMNWWRAKQKEDMFLFLVQFQLLFHHFLFYKKSQNRTKSLKNNFSKIN